MSFQPIDIEYLKGGKPLDKTGVYKLWEALKRLSDGLIEVSAEEPEPISIIESPRGKIDGVNKKFLLSSIPKTSFIAVYENGLLLLKNTDFAVKDNEVSFTTPPAIASVIQVIYAS